MWDLYLGLGLCAIGAAGALVWLWRATSRVIAEVERELERYLD